MAIVLKLRRDGVWRVVGRRGVCGGGRCVVVREWREWWQGEGCMVMRVCICSAVMVRVYGDRDVVMGCKG